MPRVSNEKAGPAHYYVHSGTLTSGAEQVAQLFFELRMAIDNTRIESEAEEARLLGIVDKLQRATGQRRTSTRQYLGSLFPVMLGMSVVSVGAHAMGSHTWPLWGKALFAVCFIAASFFGMCMCMMRAERW